MPEIRLNVISREWVIIATERAKRPADFRANNMDRAPLLSFVHNCPFCLGNEYKIEHEFVRIGEDGKWKIRVVGNKYAALSPTGEKNRHIDGFSRMVSGVGIHEVIIEGAEHNMHTALFELSHLQDIVRTYRDRFVNAYNDPRVEHVIIFKNHGDRAGTSLEHPHAQLVGTPVVPMHFRERVQSAMHYFDDAGTCIACAVIKKDREEGARVVIDTEHFVTLVPYAALTPFHMWIFPKRHSATFSSITEDEVKDLAYHLKTVLLKLYHGLDDPDYNYTIKSSRPKDANNEYCHWYVSIVPRVSQAAGFELGSGMFMNMSLPEETAAFMRSIKVE